jgi:endonuclease/exonuclease/phosphatase family metal-dependent hydrolase
MTIDKKNKKNISPATKILILLNLILILAIFLSYASVFISPEKIWIIALFGLAYPYIAVCNLIFVLFWIILRKKYFLLSLIALLLGWNQLKLIVQFNKNDAPESVKSHFKLLSYNLHNLSSLSGSNNAKNQDQVFNFLKDSDPDVVNLQEFYSAASESNDVLRKLSLKMNTPFFYSAEYYTLPNPKRSYSLVLLTRFPIIGNGTLRSTNEKAYCIFSDVILTQVDTVRIYNVHLESIHFRSDDYAFMNEIPPNSVNSKELRERTRRILWKLKEAFKKRAIQVRLLREHIEKSPYPVIVCGDFNDVPSSYAYHQLSHNLNDAFVDAGFGFGFTYGGSLPFPIRIDHILLDRKFKAYNLKYPKVRFSDHYPLISNISIN